MLRRLVPRFPDGGYIPHIPHPPQQLFLLLGHVPEVFYGGAAGGGKSDAILMAALQYADVPGYSALIIRRTFADLALPGAIMDRAGEWLGPTKAIKKEKGRRWIFPTSDPDRPATLTFGFAATHSDITRYQGAEFQFAGVDELTHFEERTYRYLFSRLRGPALPCAHCGHMTSQPAGEERAHDEGHELEDCACTRPEPDREGLPKASDGLTLADVPLRMRSGSNPGGVGHQWVNARFVDRQTRKPGAIFVPAKLRDNPSLDRRSYRKALSHLDETERMRLEEGDWTIADEGEVFERGWFPIVDEPAVGCEWVRYWDLAATAVDPRSRVKTDPDWTVGALVGLDRQSGRFYVADVTRFRAKPFDVEQRVAQTAQMDGRRVRIRMEQEPGSSGVNTIASYRRTLAGWDFDGVRPSGSKLERARPVSSAAKAGSVLLVSAPWNRELLDEAAAFPGGSHDDQIDALSGAIGELAFARTARISA